MTIAAQREQFAANVPVESWETFYRRDKATVKQGAHALHVGPTQSGKTVLCRLRARNHRYVIVVGTKPKDPSLDAYVAEGYTRIGQWPPRPKDLKPDREGNVRLILWPKIVKREDLRKYRDTFARMLEDVFVDGNWCIVIDEGLWVASRKGLGLDQPLADIAFGGASNGISLYLCIQRPSGISRITWSSVEDAYIFHMGITDDLRELASLGTADRNGVGQLIGQKLKGHQFLALPTRGTGRLVISEVDAGAI